jgi:hypothetical protein
MNSAKPIILSGVADQTEPESVKTA